LRTTQFPARRAATICVKASTSGEFHGTIDTTTPYGRLSTSFVRSPPHTCARHQSVPRSQGHLLPLGKAEKLAAHLGQRLAVLADKDRGAAVKVGFQARERLFQDAGALRESETGPCRLSGSAAATACSTCAGRSAYDRSHELLWPGWSPDLNRIGAVDRLPVSINIYSVIGQGNRVKKSIRNETCQVVIIPSGDLAADAQESFLPDAFRRSRLRARCLIVVKFAGA
jgi:hypothetical protein